MMSWDFPVFQRPHNLTIQAWKGCDEFDEIELPSGQPFDAAAFYNRNPDVTYIEIADDTRCVAFYRKEDMPTLDAIGNG